MNKGYIFSVNNNQDYNFHPNINLFAEFNPSKFLDINIKVVDGKVETSVYRKPSKIPIHWTSKIPNLYKRNPINGDLN